MHKVLLWLKTMLMMRCNVTRWTSLLHASLTPRSFLVAVHYFIAIFLSNSANPCQQCLLLSPHLSTSLSLLSPPLSSSPTSSLSPKMSGYMIYNNTFINCHAGSFIGGGRRNQVLNNTYYNCSLAVHVDNRGMTWQADECKEVSPHYSYITWSRWKSAPYKFHKQSSIYKRQLFNTPLKYWVWSDG